MILPKEDADLFFKLMNVLLFFTNKKYPVIENLTSPDIRGRDIQDIARLHEKLFSHTDIITSFVSENPFLCSKEERDIISTWRNFVGGNFFVCFDSSGKAIFLDSKKEPRAYEVYGLYEDIRDMVPFEPFYLATHLLPFKDKIVYSGLLNSFNVHLGGGMKKSILLELQMAKSEYGIISSLNQPPIQKENRDEEMLRFYLKSEKNRYEYNEDIQKIIKKVPSLETVYYQELGRLNSKKIRKKLSEAGIQSAWFAIFEDTILSSGETEEEVRNLAYKLLPEAKRDCIVLFQHKNK